MCLKNIGMYLGKRYLSENLYVGLLGFVKKEGKTLTIDANEKRFIIFKRVKCTYWDFGAEDIFTGKKYFFWSGNTYNSDTMYRSVGGYAVYMSYPIEKFLSQPKRHVSKNELLYLYNQINTPKLPSKEKNSEEINITDSILKTILETSTLVKKSLLSDNEKEMMIDRLDGLARYYIDEINKVNSNDNSNLSFDDEYSVRMEVIKELAQIELKLQDKGLIKRRRLALEYNQFRRELNGE